MATTADDPQLPPTRAHEIVSRAVDCARRAGVARFELAASRPVDGFTREYDTLVVVIQPQHRHLQRHVRREQLPNADDVGGACWLREALLLIYGVSGCRGFSFHENPTFWTEVLSLKLSRVVPITSHGFPRVALEWDPRHLISLPEYTKIVSQRLLETSVLDLFTVSSPLPLSPKGLALLADAYTWSRTRSREHHEIECVVVLGFARVASATKALVHAVLSAAKTAVSNPLNDTLSWIGVRLVGSDDVQYAHHGLLSIANLAIITRLCEMLPPSLVVDVQMPTSAVQLRAPLAPSLKRAFVAFLRPAIGGRDTEWLGRLAVLDLTYRAPNPTVVIPALDFAALGTLLPLSRSLRKLFVAVATTSDLLWLAYAVVHPLTRTSTWRTLHLDGQHDGEFVEWQQAHSLVTSPSMFATLWSLLTQSPSQTRSETHGAFVWRTAKIASDVVVLSPDKSSTVAQLVVGQIVELCDATTPIDELMLQYDNADLDDVAVVVAGVGIGWIHKRHLSDVSNTYFDGQPRSNLTTLALGRNLVPMSDLTIGLEILGASLKHLRVPTYKITVRDVARACPLLESLEMPHAYSHPPLSDTNATTSAMLPSLRDVGLVCDVSSPDACFDLLYRLPVLRSLRLVCRMTFLPQDWNRVDQHVTALIAAKTKTLRSLMVITRYRRHESTWPLVDVVLGCSSPMKRALLSVVRAAAQDESGARHALASLGADVLPLVFAFVGPNLTIAEVVGDDLWPKAW